MSDLIKQFSGRDDLPERDKDEHYVTPYPAASLMSEILYRYWCSTRDKDQALALVDIGADEGQWGEAWGDMVGDLDERSILPWRTYKLAGIEKRLTHRYHNPDDHGVVYDEWVVGDATDMNAYPADRHYPIAFGNPPYLISQKQGARMTQFLFDLKLKFEVCAFLLQTNYLASQQRYEALFQDGLAVVAQSYSRIHFEGRGKQQYREYAFYIWDQSYSGMPQLTWFDANTHFIDPRFLVKYGGTNK